MRQRRCERCGRLLDDQGSACPRCTSHWRTFRRLVSYLGPYRGRLFVQAAASLAVTATGLVPPAITRWIVDRVLAPDRASSTDVDARLRLLAMYVLALVGIRLLSWAAEWLHGWVVSWLGARVTADLRGQLYRHLEMLGLAFYDRQEIGALASRVTSDASTLQEFLIRGLPYVLTNGLTMVGIVIIMLTMSWQLTLWVVLPVPILWLWSRVFWRRMNGLFDRWWQGNARFSAQLNESLSGIREVKAFGQQRRESARFDVLNRHVFVRMTDAAGNRLTLLAAVGIVTGAATSLVWLFGGRQVLQGGFTLGALVAFYNYVLLFTSPLQWFGQFSDSATRAFTGAQRIFDVLDTAGEAYSEPGAVRTGCAPGRIDFRDVRFGYEKTRPVLHGITLNVAPGEMVGIVGRSGAGKTTLVNLVCRFYEFDEGSIELDGVDIRRVRLEDLRAQIGVVAQDPVLVSGTIGENIAYGRPGATLHEIVEAAKVANAHSFILEKKNGYDTEVGERGRHLSVGEQQRVALARAVLRNPRILILDEATSSVDALSEALIHQAIFRLAEGRTCFIVAHRLSTLKTADRLVLLDRGTISEVGTYEELLARGGAFYELVRLQEQPLDIAVEA